MQIKYAYDEEYNMYTAAGEYKDNDNWYSFSEAGYTFAELKENCQAAIEAAWIEEAEADKDFVFPQGVFEKVELSDLY